MATLEAQIVAVTVYTDRARITRRGRVRLAAGEQTVVLPEVPAQIEADSVRASGRGANVRILGVEVQRRFVTEAPEENIAEVQGKLQALQDAEQALADEDAAAGNRLDFLKTLQDNGGVTLGKSFAYGQASLENVQAMADYLAREFEAVQARRREIARRRRELAKEIQAVAAGLASVQHVRPYERREIHVAVEAGAETELELEIVYVTTGASWHPIYDIRLVEGKVAFTYLAGVSQRTGEDWPAAELSLSTARPAVSRAIPELSPWYVGVPRPVPPPYPAPASAPMMPRAAAPGGGMDRAMPQEQAAPPPPAPVVEAEIVSSGAAVTYRVARPVAVPSDGSPHRTTVTTLDLDAKLDYVTVPKLAEEAYLRATVRNSSRFILLPGAASIFHGADFVGATDLEMIVPNEEFELQLGVDNRVKVERELAEHTTGKSFIGNTRRIVYGYRIKLTNLLESPARVTAYDQLPLSRHEEIKVRLQEVAPPPVEQTDLGRLKWEFVLEPQQQQAIEFSFVLEHPRNLTITGIG